MMNLNFFYLFILMIFVYLNVLMLMPSNLYKFHPFFLVLLLIFYILFLSLKLNMLMSSYWYSYILFLVMIGGLMILFIYFTSLANNELFVFSKNYYLFLSMKFLFFMIFLYFMMKNDFIMMFLDTIYLEIMEVKLIISGGDYTYLIKSLMMDYLIDVNIFIIMYLFFTMICCILLCQKMMVPLRQMINM